MTSVMPTYGRVDISFEEGKGPYLFTSDGDRYLDFTSGIAVTGLGHAHPHLVKTLTEQASRLWHTSNLYVIPEQERLAERLCANSFAELVFFCNSGAEAMEGVIKIARKYQSHVGRPDRYRIIVFSGAFHGRTLATISASDSLKGQEGFGPMTEGFDRVPFGDAEAVRAAVTSETAAILVEPVQGESGIFPSEDGFLRELREIADAEGLLLLFDEVQCGVGRTGALFGHTASGVKPDVMGLAKGLGGGFPIGAVMATNRAAAGMGPGTHGCTFGGNPIAAACANAVLDVLLTEGFLEQVSVSGHQLRDAVDEVAANFPYVLPTVRSKGLMIGMKCGPSNIELVDELRRQKVLTVPAGDNVVRFLPPLNIENKQINEAQDALAKACKELSL